MSPITIHSTWHIHWYYLVLEIDRQTHKLTDSVHSMEAMELHEDIVIGRCSRKLFVCRYHELIFTSQIGNNWWRCATDTVIWATVPSAHISIRLSLEQQRLNWISLASMSNVIDQLKLFETYLLLRQPQSLPSDSPHSQSMVYVTINYIRKTLNLPQYLHCTANWRSSLSHCYKLMFCSTFTFH